MSLALRGLLDLLVNQVRVLKAPLDPKDLVDPLELLVAPSQGNLEALVDLANQAVMEHLVRRETLGHLALRDQGEPLDLLEALDPLASLLLESLDLPVCLEQWDPEESLV